MNAISSNDVPVLSNTEISGNKKTKGKNARKYLKEYCEISTIHGFKYLVEKRSRFERCFWGFFILTSFVACCYLISRIYRKYDQSPVIVSFATKESPIFTVPFPAVTICPMSKSRKNMLNFTAIINRKIGKENSTDKPTDELWGQYMTLLCDRGTNLFPQNDTFTDEFFDVVDKVKLPWSTLFKCKFMGDYIPCKNIFTPIVLDEGICFTFNMLDRQEIFKKEVVHYAGYHQSRKNSTWNIDDGYSPESKLNNSYPRRALLSGADNALDVILFQYQSNTDYVCVKDAQGYSVSLHNPSSIPSLKKQYFQVQFDSAALAVVQPRMMTTSEEVKRYDPKDRECYRAHERPLRYFEIYTPANCRLECLTDYTLKYCGCVNYYMPRNESTSICGNGKWYCMIKAERKLKKIQLKQYMADSVDEEVRENSCNCLQLCTDLTYDMEQSQTEWNWRDQMHESNQNLHKILSKKARFSKLSVFFKTEQFLTSQRNELYGPTDFLANFGGLLGLFTGFSLLSLVEIIYFLTIRLFYNKRRYKVWAGLNE